MPVNIPISAAITGFESSDERFLCTGDGKGDPVPRRRVTTPARDAYRCRDTRRTLPTLPEERPPGSASR